MAFKKWQLMGENKALAEKISKTAGISMFLAEILVARGYDDEGVFGLLAVAEQFEDPFLLPDMDKAVERLRSAIEKKERIIIFGDYDVDGITSVVILFSYLEKHGANVGYYIPDRENEGYGLNLLAIEKLKQESADLILTVDNGIVATDEVNHANSLGLEVIITDHHTVRGELPAAVAIVDPMREDYAGFKRLAGVAVAFKLIVAMENGKWEDVFEDYGAFVCIGTVADVMPIVDENRFLVKLGLKLLESTQIPGLRALKSIAGLDGKTLKTSDISFLLAPRINATARLNFTQLAVDLLLCTDETRCGELALEIEKKNIKRKKLEKQVLNEVYDYLAKHPDELNRRTLVIEKEGWHHGVIGIVAAKICDHFSKPCLIIGIEGETAKGSGRSVEGFPLIDAMNSLGDLFIKHGGHKVAVGVTLLTEKIAELKGRLENYAKENFEIMPVAPLIIDKVVEIDELSIPNVKSIDILAPFGEGNRLPVFLLKNLVIGMIIPLCGGKYVKLRIDKPSNINLLCFKMTIDECIYSVGDVIDAVVSCSLDKYGVLEQLTVKVIDLRFSNFDQEKYLTSKKEYENFKRNEECEKLDLKPNRDEIATIYRCIRRERKLRDVDATFLKAFRLGVDYGKFRVILDILLELEIISLEEHIKINEMEGKRDLETSRILASLN
ncbi:hypothetical protein FACS189481_2840 [Clostridia bacterium]|nr:hypothetical protein FACS189481_2840 [Clostridia bacterium]